MDKNTRARRWCFTLNNYTESELDNISAIECKYLLYGHEKGENGTPHLQGYIVFQNPKSFSRMKKWIPRAHFEVAYGTNRENYTYCTKQDEEPFEKGTLPEDKHSKINASQELKRDPINGMKIINSKRICAGIKLEQQVFKEIMLDSLNKPDIVYIYGATGTGKTYFAIKDAIFHHGRKNVSLIKFDKSGFAHCNNPQADCLVWMEFRPSCMAATDFLELTDGYGCFLNVKHGGMFIRPKAIYICSILAPSEIYKEEINAQFQRRITRFVDKNKDPFMRTVESDEGETVEWGSD